MSSEDSDDDGFYGPSLPPPVLEPANRQEIIGPVLPTQVAVNAEESDEEGPAIGPLLPGDTNDPHRNHRPVLKSSGDQGPQREEWMTVVPQKVEKRLGFKSVTSFSKRPIGPESGETKRPAPQEADAAVEELTESSRVPSLLETHQQLKKAKLAPEKPERQPFDPEKDLQVHKLDSKQTRSVINNSKLLNTRFSTGPSKFL